MLSKKGLKSRKEANKDLSIVKNPFYIWAMHIKVVVFMLLQQLHLLAVQVASACKNTLK
jgi:hypothetical protein